MSKTIWTFFKPPYILEEDRWFTSLILERNKIDETQTGNELVVFAIDFFFQLLHFVTLNKEGRRKSMENAGRSYVICIYLHISCTY